MLCFVSLAMAFTWLAAEVWMKHCYFMKSDNTECGGGLIRFRPEGIMAF